MKDIVEVKEEKFRLKLAKDPQSGLEEALPAFAEEDVPHCGEEIRFMSVLRDTAENRNEPTSCVVVRVYTFLF